MSMIVMSRSRGEAIMVGDDILVTVIDIRGDQVRFGIDHPPECMVQRGEVYFAATQDERLRPATRHSTGEGNPASG